MTFDPDATAAFPVPSTQPLHVAGAMLSHPGLVRALNEDAVIYRLPNDSDPDSALGVLALVADGMGGHAAGEVASEMAAQCLHYLFYRRPQPVPAALAEGFAAANLAIHERSRTDPACAGMGTTCTAIVLRDNCAWLGHVGDSRAYLIRDNAIRQISEDHSLVAELVRQGTLTEAEAKEFPDRNVILRALGTQPTVEPSISPAGLPIWPGDIFVLCSDGLSDLVDDETIRQLASAQPPFEACEALIQAALAVGGHDNVSAGVIRVAEAAPPAEDAARTTRRIDVTGGPP
ncbi:MAG: Stp1/IreP family PP2C-type Ser/Thr phosphatase [Acetobacteraceae bacterium]|nr:Stp1/IreP family PP2C-type Ser/Thr phosphatase [Acetobacteraceae bacterium]